MSDVELNTEVRKGIITNFIFNFAINGGLTLWLMGAHATLAMWGEASFGPDLIATGFILSAAVAAIGMEVHRRKASRGDMAAAVLTEKMQNLAGKNRWLSSGVFGVTGGIASAFLLVAVGFVTSEMTLNEYAIFKGLWCGVLAGLIVYPSTVLGLHIGARQAAGA